MEPLCLLLSKNLSLELTAAVWSSTTYCVAPLLLRAGLHARAVALALGRSFKLRAVAGVLAVPLSRLNAKIWQDKVSGAARGRAAAELF